MEKGWRFLFFQQVRKRTKVKKIQKLHDSYAAFLYHYKVSTNIMKTNKE